MIAGDRVEIWTRDHKKQHPKHSTLKFSVNARTLTAYICGRENATELLSKELYKMSLSNINYDVEFGCEWQTERILQTGLQKKQRRIQIAFISIKIKYPTKVNVESALEHSRKRAVHTHQVKPSLWILVGKKFPWAGKLGQILWTQNQVMGCVEKGSKLSGSIECG